ncbi:MAG: hypothetical protein JSU93_01945 [Methanobacteriota archaeon]|nr:MAG: hypothetical protein JSU93_01945 [Euryarchaeota archaeon]
MRSKKVSDTAVLAGVLAFMLAFASLSFIATPVSAALTGEWVEETSMEGPRAQAVVLYDAEGIAYVIGGVNSTFPYSATNETSSYDLDTGSWNSLAPLPIPARGAAGVVGPDGDLYIFGGGLPEGAVQIYDPDTDSWNLGTSMPTGVWQGRAGLGHDGMIYVMGGVNETSGITDAVQIYDPLLDSWSLGTPMPSARNSGALVSLYQGSTFYYLGGSTSSWADSSGTVYVYSVDGDYWYTNNDMPVPLASQSGALAVDGAIYVIGGGGDGYNVGPGYDTTYWYSSNDGDWHDGPVLPVGVRHAGAVATTEGMLYLFGGNNATEVMSTVLSLEVAHLEVSLSGTPVAQGGFLNLGVMLDVVFADPSGYYVEAYLVSNSGTFHSGWDFWIPVPEPAELTLDISETMPPGDYTLVVYVGYYSSNFPEESFEVTVTDAYTFEEQLDMLKTNLTELLDAQAADIADLETQLSVMEAALGALEAQLSDADGNITDLQAQLDELQNTLTELEGSMNDVQTSVDNKADNSLLYVVIGLLIVVIVLMALMMVMGRRSGVPPPPPSA